MTKIPETAFVYYGRVLFEPLRQELETLQEAGKVGLVQGIDPAVDAAIRDAAETAKNRFLSIYNNRTDNGPKFGLDDVDVTAYTPDEKLVLTLPRWTSPWPVGTLEAILNTLRKKGKCHIVVTGGPNEDVPTVAEILYGRKQ